MAPITTSVDVSEVQARLLAQRDFRGRSCDLARHERPPSTRTLVIEQDAITRKHPIRLTIVDNDPVRIQFSTSIGRPGVERRRLALRGFDDLTIELGRGRLIELDMFLQAARSDRVEQAKRAQSINVPSILRHLKRHLDVRLRPKVVHFGGLDLGDDINEVGTVAQVAVMQLELSGICIYACYMRVFF